MKSNACEAMILVVDDDPEVCSALSRVLRADGYGVRSAANADEAIARLQEQVFDVVLCDYDMPGLNGIDLLHRIRIRYPQVLRILLTGNSDLELAVRALNEGSAERFLLKPWQRLDLSGLLRVSLYAPTQRDSCARGLR